MLRIALGADHGGFLLKEKIKEYLTGKEYEVFDFGTNSTESVDYPDFAFPCALSVSKHEYDFGILVCTTGIGMSICANKVKGIRAALVSSVDDARLTREHNDSNILCLSAKNTDLSDALAIVDVYLSTIFLGDRHLRRVKKIESFENEKIKD